LESFFASIQGRWPAGRVDYHWHVLPDTSITAAQLHAPYRELTHRPGIAPVAPQRMHVTLLHVGPFADITVAEMTAITHGVRERCRTIAAFDLTFDRPDVGSVAVECLARPGRPAEELWRITAEESRAVLGDRFPTVLDHYYAHASIGYATGSVDQRPMRAWLTDHDIPPATVPVSRISLVAQSHNGQRITWNHILDIPLTAPA
jgi:2'-5' RNA ligase